MNKTTYTLEPSHSSPCPLAFGTRSGTNLLTTALLLSVGSLVAYAGPTTTTTDSKDIVAPAPAPTETLGSNIHGVMNFEFSDKYYTPRGLTSTTNGPTFQPVFILLFDLVKDKGCLNDLTFNVGCWNDIDFRENGANHGNWDELDGFFGLEAKMFKDWKFDAEETFFKSMTDSYRTSTNFDFRATYMDHWFGDSGFSINPFSEIFVETTQKATVSFDYATDKKGYYGVIGMDPTYKFSTIPLTLELPTSANIVSASFYQRLDGSPGGSGFAVMTTGLKASTPLTFIPISYGKWTAYASAHYIHLDNPGLLDGNQALTNNPIGSNIHRDRDLYQLKLGLNCFF